VSPAEAREPAETPEPTEDPVQARAEARAQARAQDFAELGGLMLARSTVDRVSVRRGDPEWVAAAWADPHTRVLVLDTSGQALVRFGDKEAELVLVPPSAAPGGLSFLLGVDDDGVTYFGLLERPADALEPAPSNRPPISRRPGWPRPAPGSGRPGCARPRRCSATGTPACSRMRWPWPTGTSRTRTAPAAAR
jgi:hypothetical protein